MHVQKCVGSFSTATALWVMNLRPKNWFTATMVTSPSPETNAGQGNRKQGSPNFKKLFLWLKKYKELTLFFSTGDFDGW